MTHSSRPARPGGPAMFNGVVHQMLWTLWRGLKLRPVYVEPMARNPKSALLVVEPARGGDLAVHGSEGRSIEQIKARSTGRPWTLTELIEEVIPDLYRASAGEGAANTYRFVTNGCLGPWRPEVYDGFFRSLRGRDTVANEPLGILESLELPSLKRYAKLKHQPTERGLFHYIVDHLRERHEIRERETRDETCQRLLALLANLEIEEGQSPDRIVELIHQDLRSLGVPAEQLENKLDQLCGALTRLAAEGPSEIEPEKFFAGHGLQALPLYHWARFVRRSRALVEKTTTLHGYRPEQECREHSPLASAVTPSGADRQSSESLEAGREPAVLADRRPVILFGESGQGKSWVLYRAARDLAREEKVVLLLDSTGDLRRDRDEVARQFCEKLWGLESSGFSLTTLARKVHHQVQAVAGRPWLTVLIDGAQDPAYVEELATADWTGLGIRVVVAITAEDGGARLEPLSDSCHLLPLRGLNRPEVLHYLKLRLGEPSRLPPADVMDLLKRPLFARLYAELASQHGGWVPHNEYELVEKYWSEHAQHAPVAISILIEAARELLEEGRSYPWPVSHLRGKGLGETELTALLRTHLVRTVDGGRRLEIWHDRLLQWAVAEGLVAGRMSGEIAAADFEQKVRACSGVAATRAEAPAARRFGYVPMDVVWLLADPARQRGDDVVHLLAVLERPGEPSALVASLGPRIVPHVFAHLRQLEPRAYARHRYTEILEEIDDPSVAAHAAELLNREELHFQRVAVRLLKSQGTRDALDRLWQLHCRWTREVAGKRDSPQAFGESRSGPTIHDQVETERALGSCVRDAPDWLEKKIRQANPATDPIHTLVYLLPKLAQGTEVWLRVKKLAFQRVRPERERCLAVCIQFFQDREELDWLEERINRQEDSLGPMARSALYLLAPERAAALAIDPDALLTEYLARIIHDAPSRGPTRVVLGLGPVWVEPSGG